MKRRQGFTLVELLVSMALIIFIMAILSGAFVAASNTFRNLKASGDMAEKLRATTQLLQRDLSVDHFEGKKRLSNPNFWLNGPPQQGYFQIWQNSVPSTVAGSACYIESNGLTDVSGITSYRSVDHALAFTIKLRGNQMGDFLTASGPLLATNTAFGPQEARYETGTTYNFQWGEVAWFMQPQLNPALLNPVTGLPQQDTTAPDQATGAAGLPLYTLYRRQRLAVPDNSATAITATAYTAAVAVNYLELSCWNNGGNFYFNTPFDLTVPFRRFGNGNATGFTTLATDQTALATQGATPNPTMNGADIQMTDVVSFDVRVLVAGVPAPLPGVDPFVTLYSQPFTLTPALGAAQTPPIVSYFNGNPSTIAATGPMFFDTWSSVNDGLGGLSYAQWNLPGTTNTVPATSIPMWNPTTQTGPIIQAIQISIRIWDAKTNQTRQVTMVQAM